jgi:hypothetical protein
VLIEHGAIEMLLRFRPAGRLEMHFAELLVVMSERWLPENKSRRDDDGDCDRLLHGGSPLSADGPPQDRHLNAVRVPAP